MLRPWRRWLATAPHRRAAGSDVAPDGQVRVALAKQPLSPNGPSKGPATMAEGGIQRILAGGRDRPRRRGRLTAEEDTEYGGWKKLGMSLGHFADIVARTSATAISPSVCSPPVRRCPAWSPACSVGTDARAAASIGMLWLDAHPDFNTPETTRSGSLGGMPVAVATGRALQEMRLDAKLDPPMADRTW